MRVTAKCQCRLILGTFLYNTYDNNRYDRLFIIDRIALLRHVEFQFHATVLITINKSRIDYRFMVSNV